MDEKTNEIEKLKFHVFRDERFIDLNLYQFGWERTSPTHSYGPYARNHYLFHYVLSGTGKLIAQDSKGISREYQIKSGQDLVAVTDEDVAAADQIKSCHKRNKLFCDAG